MIPHLYSLGFRPRLYRPDGQGYWSGHLPFAADLVDAVRPGVLVELGTYYGESYFGFCQAVQERNISCQCYAIDNWSGDDTTGRYTSSVFEEVSEHNVKYYSSFSSLLRMNFQDAANLFTDGSVDLLHLDGCHTYDGVKCDFEIWLPKVSPGGIILIHDIAVRKADFGVWRFWEEISGCFPSFSFWHSSGLGVLANSKSTQFDSPFLAALFGGTTDSQAIRNYYVLCAERLQYAPRTVTSSGLKCQLYSPGSAGYSEERSEVADVVPDEWQSLEFPAPLPGGRLRLDPVNRAAVIEIADIEVACPATNTVLWRLNSSRLEEISCEGTALHIPLENRLIVLSYGDDPQMYLPPITAPEYVRSVLVRCLIRIDLGFGILTEVFGYYLQVQTDRAKLQAALARSDAELADLQKSFAAADAKIADLQTALESATAKKGEREVGIARLQAMVTGQQEREQALLQDLESMRNSLSWRLMLPARWVASTVLKIDHWLLRLLYESRAFAWTGKNLAKAVYVYRLPLDNLLLPPSALFDAEYYAASNPDVSADRNLWAHYIGFGADEGRKPHPLFTTRFYLAQNPDVAVSGMNPLVHYWAYGAAEGRRPHPGFDPAAYLRQRPDVKASGMNPLLHYWKYGRHEHPQAVSPAKALHGLPKPRKHGFIARRPKIRPTAGDVNRNEGRDPLISILLPTFNTPPKFLRLAIQSVRQQTYPRWQLCIHDDGSSSKETLAILNEYDALKDPRIAITFGQTNSGIATASNAALTLAKGEYVGMLDHDDELERDALLEISRLLREDPSLDAVYTDQDLIDASGKRIGSLLKPDWSPELFRGVMYVNHLLVVRSELIRQIGGFDPAFDRIQDFEMMLRISEKTNKIGHVRRILYHWRSIPGSIASGPDSKGVIEPLQSAAVNAHLARCGIKALAAPHPSHSHRLMLRPTERTTFPQVVVAVREVERRSIADCVDSILEKTTYRNIMVCVPGALPRGQRLDQRVVVRDFEALHSQITPQEVLLWIDSDLQVLTPDWIQTLLMYCEQPGIGCVSPLIIRNGTVWCSGLVLGMNDSIGYPMRGLPADAEGYAGSLCCSREVSAVSGECLMISGAVYRELGGRIKYYSTSVFEGADLALRALTAKKRNIVTPQALVRKTSSVIKETSKLDENLFVDRWKDLIQEGDRFYNTEFSLDAPGYFTEVAAGGSRE